MNNLQLTKEFLESVWSDAEGYRVIYTTQGKNQFFRTNADALEYAAQKSSDGKDVCFSVHLFGNDTNRKKENAIGCRALYLDIDVKPNEARAYATKEDAENAVDKFIGDSGLPEPTKVCSGNGSHLYWLFNQTLSESEWLAMAGGLRDLYRHHGLKADESVTTDAARILRVPGTVNYKDAANPKECKLLSNEIQTYEPQEIKRALDEAASKVPNPKGIFGDISVNGGVFNGGIEKGFADNPQESQEIARLCMEYISLEKRGGYNDGWLNIGLTLCNVFAGDNEGLELWDNFSKPSPKYKAGECVEKWQTFGGRDDGLGIGSLILWAREDSGNPDLLRRETQKAFGAYGQDDIGNAERFIDSFGKDLRHDFNKKTWLCWNGKHWETDAASDVQELAKQISGQIKSDALKIPENTENQAQKGLRQSLISWGRASANMPKINGVINAASSDKKIRCRMEDFDLQPRLISAENGTIDLRTGELQPHNQSDYITKILPYSYNPNAKCLKFMEWLTQIQPKKDVRDFLQIIAGLALTGTAAKKFFVFFGQSHTGKSTFGLILKRLVGAYGTNLDISELLQQRFGNTNGHSDQIAKLRGARLILTDEPNEYQKFNEGRIKTMTGGDGMSASRKGQIGFDFDVQGTIIISTNYVIKFNPTDPAMVNRIAVVPFSHCIGQFYRMNSDINQVVTEFMREADGILAWAVEGAMRFQNDGVIVPDTVRQVTAEYIRQQNELSDFLEDETRFVLGAGYQIDVDKLYSEYEYSLIGDIRAEKLGRKRFNACVESYSIRRNSNRTVWLGVGLRSQYGNAASRKTAHSEMAVPS